MKKFIISILAFLFPISMFAQSGVKWENIPYMEALEKIEKNENGKKYIFLYMGTDIPYDTEWVEHFSEDAIGKYLNEKFVCLMADAATPNGKILAKSFKTHTFPTFYLINSKGEREFVNTVAHNPQSLIIRLDSRLEKLDSTLTYRYRYNTTKDTAIAYEFLRYAAIAEDPNSIGYFVSEFFNDLLKSPNFWNVYKSTLSIEYMTMIDWTMEYRNSFIKAAPIEQIEADLSTILIEGLAGYAFGKLWGNEVTITDACKYLQELKVPSRLELYIMAFASTRATGNTIPIKQLCSRQSLTRFLTTSEIQFVKEMFLSLDKGFNKKEREHYLNIFETILNTPQP